MPKEDQTPMAELKNWADRVNGEVSSAVIWEGDWAGLYKPGQPTGYAARIADLEARIASEKKRAGDLGDESVYRAHYKGAKPYKEIQVPVAGARSASLSTMDPDEILGSSGTTNSKMTK